MSEEAWDDFVEERPESTFCHPHRWSRIMEEVLGHECIHLSAVDGSGHVRGILPLVHVRSLLFGHHLVSLPFLNYGGPVGEPAANALLGDEAARIASSSGADLLELRTRTPLPDTDRLVTNQRKVTVILDLPDDPEVLWMDGLKSKVRSQVRRPKKEGMEARFGPEELEPFYEVFARNMRDLGTPVLPRAFFEGIATFFPEHVEFGAVYLDETPVAAGCGFVWRDEFEITWASSIREYSRMAPNMLLYWSFMERSIERGLDAFNFGRCTPDSGTHRFKSQWGGRDVPLPWAHWSPSGRTATPNPEGSRVYRLATRAWSRLPLPVANRLGPLLSRQLP